jgi:chemotaxis family two-component system sensor kinase Cph1
VIGSTLEFLFPPAEVEDTMDLIRGAMSGERWESVEIGIRHAGGAMRTLLWNSATVMSADARTPTAAIAQGQDITERKLAEAQLRAFSQDLERSNKELEQFAYVASHDLQEPLRMVASYVQLLARRYRGKLDADADEFIGFAVDGASRMQAMINDLLAISRVGTRGQALTPTPLEDVLSEVMDNIKLAVEECGAVVTHDSLPTVMGDGVQLGQLFQNLVANAIKFRGKERTRVHIGVRRGGAETAASRAVL